VLAGGLGPSPVQDVDEGVRLGDGAHCPEPHATALSDSGWCSTLNGPMNSENTAASQITSASRHALGWIPAGQAAATERYSTA
jgi:hypothetical protein